MYINYNNCVKFSFDYKTEKIKIFCPFRESKPICSTPFPNHCIRDIHQLADTRTQTDKH